MSGFASTEDAAEKAVSFDGPAPGFYGCTAMGGMFESRRRQRVLAFVAGAPSLRRDCADCWAGLRKRFDPTHPNAGTP